MRVLIACETSGMVRRAFRSAGHDAWSCDILPSDDGSPNHIVADALEIAYAGEWDLMIAHPPCTYVSVSGIHWNTRRPERAKMTESAIEFAEKFWRAPIRRKAIENPIGVLSTRSCLGKPTQVIQPFDFGSDASKATCLWLNGLMPLRPTDRVAGRIVTRPDGRPVERWANQTDSGQNRLPPSEDRWKLRSETYIGIANAMASQWG